MIVDLLLIVAAIGLIIAIYKIKFSSTSIQKEIQQAVVTTEKLKETAREEVIDLQNPLKEEANSDTAGWQGEDSNSEEDSDDGEVLDVRKQLRKQQKQKQKQQRKQAQEDYLEMQKQKRQKYDKDTEEREKQEQERRRKEDEIVQQLREEERKRKEEEFNKWKDMFSVEEVGQHKLSEDEERKKIQALNRQLIAVLRKNKLSLLQDLSHKFKLSTKDMVSKIQELEQASSISGIFDERGKYLVIEGDEWQSIKNYITARGRVKKTDIMTECAKLIKIPDYVEEDLLELVKEGEGEQ